MGDAASASGRRCPKHPSQAPFTGFCSACLLDRLHATNLVLASPQPLDLAEEEAEAERTATRSRRTTLLHLFQLEDHEKQEQSKAAAPSSSTCQDPPPGLQRKRSLRQSCSEWIACCDTSPAAANHSSFLPSRQSLDASCPTAAPAPARAAAADATTNGSSVVERRTGSLRVCAIRGFLSKPADHLLNRSFSESSRTRYAHHNPGINGARSSSSQSQGISVSSTTGMGSSEISFPDDSLVHHCRPRLKNRLQWLRRSRSSVHYSSPTSLTPFRSRSSSTRSTADKAQQPSRRLNLNIFAAGFFGAQRHRWLNQ
jgi:hypothetical protein